MEAMTLRPGLRLEMEQWEEPAGQWAEPHLDLVRATWTCYPRHYQREISGNHVPVVSANFILMILTY